MKREGLQRSHDKEACPPPVKSIISTDCILHSILIGHKSESPEYRHFLSHGNSSGQPWKDCKFSLNGHKEILFYKDPL